MLAAFVLPFFNIPLILKIIKRKSSKDISMVWAVGVWVGILIMAPTGFSSSDMVWRIFNYTNIVMFTAVLFTVLKYRHG